MKTWQEQLHVIQLLLCRSKDSNRYRPLRFNNIHAFGIFVRGSLVYKPHMIIWWVGRGRLIQRVSAWYRERLLAARPPFTLGLAGIHISWDSHVLGQIGQCAATISPHLGTCWSFTTFLKLFSESSWQTRVSNGFDSLHETIFFLSDQPHFIPYLIWHMCLKVKRFITVKPYFSFSIGPNRFQTAFTKRMYV